MDAGGRHGGYRAGVGDGLGEEQLELVEEVCVVAEEGDDLLVHLGYGVVLLAVRVQDLQEALVRLLLPFEALLDLLDVVPRLVDLRGLARALVRWGHCGLLEDLRLGMSLNRLLEQRVLV